MTMHNFGNLEESDFTPLAETFSERRRDSPLPVLLELVKKVHDGQKEIDRKLTKHMTDETQELAVAVANVIQDGFPQSDLLGHRAHHEAVIKEAEDRAKFWQEMRIAGAKWFGLGVLTFLAGAAWTTFLKGPHP